MVISCGADHPETIKICYLVIMNGDDLKKIVFLFFLGGGATALNVHRIRVLNQWNQIDKIHGMDIQEVNGTSSASKVLQDCCGSDESISCHGERRICGTFSTQ